jgi:hypothetical protein
VPEDPPDDPPDEEVPDDPPEDDVPDAPPDEDVDDELDVSSLPPHAASAVALAKRIAARVATRPVGAGSGLYAGCSASQTGHERSIARS